MQSLDDLLSNAPDLPPEQQAEFETVCKELDQSTAIATKSKFNLLTAHEVTSTPSTPWLVKKIFPIIGLSSIYGASGSWKSFLVLDLLASVALGVPWFGHKTQKTGVLYICLESEAGLKSRLQAWEKHNRRSFPENVQFLLGDFNLLKDVEQLSKEIPQGRSEERRVGKECGSTVSYRWVASSEKKKSSNPNRGW